MTVDRTKGTQDGARAGVAATKAWLVARLSNRQCKVASRCSCVEPGGRAPRPWMHANINEIITRCPLITMGS
eukprot:scaffold9621_cov27-Phaeocystis_antarctica.AAC.1